MSYLINYLIECVTSPIAVIGLLASVIVLVSMCFNTKTLKGTLWMRSVNLFGSILSTIYGLLLGPSGLGMIILNGTLIFVNLFYLVKALIDKNKCSE